MKDDEGWWRMIKDDEGWWRMMKDDEGRWRMMKDDEEWWRMLKDDSQYKLWIVTSLTEAGEKLRNSHHHITLWLSLTFSHTHTHTHTYTHTHTLSHTQTPGHIHPPVPEAISTYLLWNIRIDTFFKDTCTHAVIEYNEYTHILQHTFTQTQSHNCLRHSHTHTHTPHTCDS